MIKKNIKKGGAKKEDCIKKKKLWNPKTKRCVNDTKLNRDKGAITPDKKVKSISPEFNKKGHNKSGFDKNGEWWFLIKDSGSGSRNGKFQGYYFYHEDYVKLKMMTFTIHKNAVKEIINKCEK